MIPLHYAPVPPSILEEEEEEEEEEDASADDDMAELFPLGHDPPEVDHWFPSRKRQRTLDWDPPEHIPGFLPPFPSTIEPASVMHSPRIPSAAAELPSLPVDGVGIDKPPTPPPTAPTQPQTIASTSAAASDYLVQVPYSQSSISAVSEWHLPSAPLSMSSARPEPRWATPATEPALIAAYHHILTHPPPPNSTHLANPQRHKVAMALLALTQSASRWDIPDTLFSSLVTNQPRVSSIGPTYPIPLGDNSSTENNKKGVDKEFKFPTSAPRSVAATERISQLVSQQGSRIPELSRHVLPVRFLNAYHLYDVLISFFCSPQSYHVQTA